MGRAHGFLLQFWLNLEIGRWTIATGETVLTGYARAWWGFGLVFFILTILGWVAPGWGLASGLALKALLVGLDGFGGGPFWTMVTFGLAAIILIGPKFAYNAVERTVGILVIAVTLGLMAVAIRLGSWQSMESLLRGALNVGFREPAMGVKEFFIALVFAGAGGTANLFYSFYLRDKQIGMSRRVPVMQNILHGKPQAATRSGFTFDEHPANASRFRAWMRYLVFDQVCFFWLLNSVTILLFIYGALIVLQPRGVVPEQGRLIWDEAAVLGQLWGRTGRTLFLMVGVATLFSTQLTLLDGCARSLAEIVHTQCPGGQRRTTGWWYMVFAIGWILAGCGITWVMVVSDLNLWNENKFKSVTAWCAGDLNADRFVDVSDFNIWNAHKYTSSFDVTSVPEPSAGGLIVALWWLLARMRQGRSGQTFDAWRLTTVAGRPSHGDGQSR